MKKPLFNKIAIIGVGLIGGSLGIAIKKNKLAHFVIGVSRNKKTISDAFSKNAIDIGTLNLKEGVKDADLVILCAPVSVILSQFKLIKPHLKSGAIVIDVGSSKKLIDETARKIIKKNPFVGCHPMAGSEKQGVLNADGHIFEGAVCFTTASHRKVDQLWKTLGSRIVPISSVAHDHWVAMASHLPHAASFSLLKAISEDLKKSPVGTKDVNPSLRGIARLSQSDASLWADIFLSNQKETVEALTALQKNLKELSQRISSKNKSKLIQFLTTANHAANKISFAEPRPTGRRPVGRG
jgi:prephenate dehydrogenase